ncbi:MAG: nitrogenase component 1 [Nitrospirota bacterium]|jgi:nitrogenase molybdenum-iron protein NifN
MRVDTLCEKARPRLIGVPTTGLSETHGSDVSMVLKQFRVKPPEHAGIAVVPVANPDYCGCLESGYATAVKEMIHCLVPASGAPTALATDDRATV